MSSGSASRRTGSRDGASRRCRQPASSAAS
jgi:hypothetical protein